jgi:hypothetical protein
VDECGGDSGKHSHRDNYHHEADAKFSKSQVRSSSHPGKYPHVDRPHIYRICYEGGQIIECLSKD